MLTYQMTCDEMCGLGMDTVVLPVASLEQHGPHLPLATDCIAAEAYANAVAQKLNAYQIPTLPISTCREHMGKMGSVWMNPDTFYQMILDICDSLQTQGFKKIVVLQGHGGIFVLGPAIRHLNATRNPDLMVCVVQAYDYLAEYHKRGLLESLEAVHADELETSLIMYLAGDLVKKDRIVDCVPAVGRPFLNYGSIFRASPSGVWGYPSLATAEKGKKLLELGTELMVQAALDAFAYMENKKTFGYSEF